MDDRFFGQCKQCGKEISSYYKSQLPTFCSYECSNKWKWENIRKRKKFDEYTCAHCGEKFLVYENDHRIKENSRTLYCSLKCWSDACRQRKHKTCPICNKAHNAKSKTCCKECAIKLVTWKSHEKHLGMTFMNYDAYKTYAEELVKEKERVRLNKKQTLTEEEKKEKKRQYVKKRRSTTKYKEYMKTYLKEYNKRNKQKRNEQQKSRMQEDELYNFKVKVRKFIAQSFRRRKESKIMHTEDVLGCSFEYFMKHIVSQFKDGMSIENYGKWQIDHIIPLCSAKNKEDVIRLCHYTNLQPLWAKENREKGSKITVV